MIRRGSSYFSASSSSTSSAVEGCPVGVLRSTGSPSLPNSTSCSCFGDSSENGPPAAACACASISRMRRASSRLCCRSSSPSISTPACSIRYSTGTSGCSISSYSDRSAGTPASFGHSTRCSCRTMSAFSAAYLVASSIGDLAEAESASRRGRSGLRNGSDRSRDSFRDHRVDVVARRRAVPHVRLQHRVEAHAAQLDAFALQRVLAVLEVMSDLRQLLVLEQRLAAPAATADEASCSGAPA